MNDRRLSRLLADAIELLDRAAPVLPQRLADMDAALNGHPRSGALDSVGGRGKTTFCEVHQRERCECGAGTPFANLSDPTGEAGIRPDRAAQDRAKLEAALRSIGRQAEEVVRLLGKYQPRQATEKERLATLAHNEREDACASCARLEVAKGVARWEPASRSVRMLDGSRQPLCAWCRQWLAEVSRLPSVAELEAHHRGQRVKRPA